MSNIFDIYDAAPLLPFLQSALSGESFDGKHNGVWLFGHGGNGKSTLLETLREALPQECVTLRAVPTWIPSVLQISSAKIVLVEEAVSSEAIQTDSWNFIMRENWNKGFIFISNSPPPKGLNCTSIEMSKTFSDPKFENKALVTPLRQLLTSC